MPSYLFFGLAWLKWGFTVTIFPDEVLRRLPRTMVGLPIFGIVGFFITLFLYRGRTRAASLALLDLPIFARPLKFVELS
jgi:hypothetical protein